MTQEFVSSTTQRYDTADAESLIEYAHTADIGGDPLVIDLADALGRALRRIAEMEVDREEGEGDPVAQLRVAGLPRG